MATYGVRRRRPREERERWQTREKGGNVAREFPEIRDNQWRLVAVAFLCEAIVEASEVLTM